MLMNDCGAGEPSFWAAEPLPGAWPPPKTWEEPLSAIALDTTTVCCGTSEVVATTAG